MSVANCDDMSVIDFPIKRVYYIYDVPKGIEREGHAHRELRQMLFCPHGSVGVSLDDGLKKAAYVLNKADIGLFVDKMVWQYYGLA